MLGLFGKILGSYLVLAPLVKMYCEVDIHTQFGFIMKDTNKLGIEIEVQVFFKRNVFHGSLSMAQ